MGFIRLGRGGVCIGLHVVVRGEVEKIFSEGECIIVIERTKRRCDDKVYDDVQGRFVLTMIRCPLVGRKEGQDGSGIEAGCYGDPVNQSEYGLVGGLVFGEVRVVRVRIGYGVDGSE